MDHIAERKGHSMDLAAPAPQTSVEAAELIEKLRGHLAVALSLLISLGFEMADLGDYLWT